MEVDRIHYLGFDIVIKRDVDPLNPRRDCDNLGTMACSHGKYRLGDVQYGDGAEAVYETLKELGYENVKMEDDYTELYGEDFVWKYYDKLDKVAIFLPLFLYDHSGITMNTRGFSCPWDSGQVGFIYVSKNKVKEEWDWKLLTQHRKEIILNILRREVQTYDYYISGEVYGYYIEPTNNLIDYDDSCWGFFGYETADWDYMIDEAKSNIRHGIKEWARETSAEIISDIIRRREMKWFIKNCFAL